MQHPRKYIFGPVPSRRLGRSLGVDVIPRKLCTLDCLYCEVGRTDKRALRRKEYIPAGEIIAEIRAALSESGEIDTVTFSGSGEPTLNSKLGEMIRAVKSFSSVPVAVITNGTLLYLRDVRYDLLAADIVLPSLDAITPSVFEHLNRPHPGLDLCSILDGLKSFRGEFGGQIWLEILFAKGYNDGEDEIERMKKVIDEIKPDRIQLNTVIRPPAEAYCEPVDEERLKEIKRLLGQTCEIIGVAPGRPTSAIRVVDYGEIVGLLQRRSMTVDETALALGFPRLDALIALGVLEEQGLVESFYHFDVKYYRALVGASRLERRKMTFQVHLN